MNVFKLFIIFFALLPVYVLYAQPDVCLKKSLDELIKLQHQGITLTKSEDKQILRSQLTIEQYRNLKTKIKNTQKINMLELSSYNKQITNKKMIANDFINNHNLKIDNNGFVKITNELLEEYIDEIAKNSIEFLYVPNVQVDPLPKFFNQVGHVAIRVNDKVYTQTGTKGFIIESLDDFILKTKKDHKIYGMVLETSPHERAVMIKYLEKVNKEQVPYNFFSNNCSQINCRALRISKIKNISKFREKDPKLSKDAFEQLFKTQRGVIKTHYGTKFNNDFNKTQFKGTMNRAFFYGIPIASVSGGSVVSVHLGHKLYELLEDFIHELELKD